MKPGWIGAAVVAVCLLGSACATAPEPKSHTAVPEPPYYTASSPTPIIPPAPRARPGLLPLIRTAVADTYGQLGQRTYYGFIDANWHLVDTPLYSRYKVCPSFGPQGDLMLATGDGYVDVLDAAGNRTARLETAMADCVGARYAILTEGSELMPWYGPQTLGRLPDGEPLFPARDDITVSPIDVDTVIVADATAAWIFDTTSERITPIVQSVVSRPGSHLDATGHVTWPIPAAVTVADERRFGYLNRDGTWAITPRFQWASFFHNTDYALVEVPLSGEQENTTISRLIERSGQFVADLPPGWITELTSSSGVVVGYSVFADYSD
ncbi:MAG: WG repeat-containing protein, partial [Propionibacteriaceae bacterium]|nr:WG repeat-containing protein [Propionibacteriaceae bacterium]